MTHLSLFSGIGGLDLAAEAAGFRTVGQCEWADYPTKVLEKHWPDVPRWRDIRTLTKDGFYERTGMRTVDIISGGFPCQPFSLAGRRKGKEDDRYLWPEMLRVIDELRPSWVVGENVVGIVTMALDQVLFDLEAQGYKARAFIIPACGVNAPHRRDRVAIVAHANCTERREDKFSGHEPNGEDAGRAKEASQFGAPGEDGGNWAVANTNCNRLEEQAERKREQGQQTRRADLAGSGLWETEPAVGRVVDGFPGRVDRLKCLGNAVVPQQFYPIFKAIYDAENNTRDSEEWKEAVPLDKK